MRAHVSIEAEVRADAEARRERLRRAYARLYGGDRGQWTKRIESAFLSDMRTINQAERQRIMEVWK